MEAFGPVWRNDRSGKAGERAGGWEGVMNTICRIRLLLLAETPSQS